MSTKFQEDNLKQTVSYGIKTAIASNIRDNCKRDKAARFLTENLSPDAVLSIASAYFTVQAYDQLREKLDAIASMRFLFGDPDYVNKIDPEKTSSKRFAIVNNGLDLKDALRQKWHRIHLLMFNMSDASMPLFHSS